MAERPSDHSACPFCGNSCSERRWVDYQYRVVCEHCGAMGPGTDMEAVAVPNWNRRASTLDAALQAQQPGAQAVAYCDPSDPINSTAFARPGTDRAERHREPLYTHPPAALAVSEVVDFTEDEVSEVFEKLHDKAPRLIPDECLQQMRNLLIDAARNSAGGAG